MIELKGGVLAPKGFMAAAVAAGIKYQDRTDMAMLFSEKPCEVAGTFTKNIVKAAPVIWDKAIVDSGRQVRVVVANSGIANACTGSEGMDICRETAKAVEEVFSEDKQIKAEDNQIKAESVLVASTGVIGMQIPLDKIRNGVFELAASISSGEEAASAAARAIMTTDTKEKSFAVSFQVGGKEARIGGMCKGSGMIHPNMCTMLSFLTTDCLITKAMLQKALSKDVENTYNMISVDGDTSTNDTCLILANGLAGNPVIEQEDKDYEAFCKALNLVNETLAKKMAEDGEGATHLFEVRVKGAKSHSDAVRLAKSVVGSSLVKAAIYGRDANWGRILAALGYSGVSFDPERVTLSFVNDFGRITVFKDGKPLEFSEDYAKELLSQPEVCAEAVLSEGSHSATAWGCDLTHEYVSINADYRS